MQLDQKRRRGSLTESVGPDQIEHDSVSHLKTKTQNSPTYKAGGRQCKRRRQRRLRSREDHRQSSLWSSSRPQRWSRSILSARRGCAVEAAPRSLSLLDTPSLEHTHTHEHTLLTLVAVYTLCFSPDPCCSHFTHLSSHLLPRLFLFLGLACFVFVFSWHR